MIHSYLRPTERAVLSTIDILVFTTSINRVFVSRVYVCTYVPLWLCSEFVEVFVGKGASRVRELFKRAEKNGTDPQLSV